MPASRWSCRSSSSSSRLIAASSASQVRCSSAFSQRGWGVPVSGVPVAPVMRTILTFDSTAEPKVRMVRMTGATGTPETGTPQPRWLNAEEQRTWLALLAAINLLDEELDRQLQRDAGMPHTYYMML